MALNSSALKDLQKAIAGPPNRQPHENLQAYVQSASIPKPKFRRGHPLIYRGQDRVIPPDSFLLPLYRHPRFLLREMWVFKPNVMERKVQTFIREAVPSQPITPDVNDAALPFSSRNCNLFAPGFVPPVEQRLPLIENAVDLAQTIVQVLRTAERVVNLVWPAVGQRHIFAATTSCPPIGDTAPLCVPLFYTELTERPDTYHPCVKMAVIVVSPWALSTADMHDMITLGKFPAFQPNPDGNWPEWTRAHKVWAQIQDCCINQGCSSFVLTTYEHWIFGSFHPTTYSQLVSTNVISYTDSRPSILEWLVFWCASTLRIPRSWNAMVSYSKNPEIGHLKDFYQGITSPEVDPDEFWTGS